MKVLFTADLHIKLAQKNVPEGWSRNRFKMFVEQLNLMQKQADILIIGGDIFDKLPSMEELELYFFLVESVKLPTIIYPGNHEAVKKDSTFFTNLKSVTSKINPEVTVVDDWYCGDQLDILPYNLLKDFAKTPEKYPASNKVLFTHVRGEIPPHVKPEVPLELFEAWELVVAGDLHSYENSQRNILYPGSPYTTSFHRSKVKTGAILLDLDSLEHEWLEFNLPQLLKQTVKAEEIEKVVKTDFDHTVYEIEGNLQELSQLKDTELIDKKVAKRIDDSALILDKEMSLVEEVKEYLEYILLLDQKDIAPVLKELQNHMDKLTYD